MQSHEAREGQWVRFITTDTKDTFIGFIVAKHNNVARVAIPKTRRTISIPYISLNNHERHSYTVEDVESMIDVALDVRDFEWLEELSELKKMIDGWAG